MQEVSGLFPIVLSRSSWILVLPSVLGMLFLYALRETGPILGGWGSSSGIHS